jgi:beta-lactamase regulating signal transducer with metallopeptidase domain
MNPQDFIKVYLIGNLLLITAYLLFSLIRRVSTRFDFNPSNRHWILIAQILIALSIGAPLLARQIPTRHLTSFTLVDFTPNEEAGIKVSGKLKHRSAFHQVKALLTKSTPASSEGRKDESLKNLILLFFGLLMTGAAVASIRLVRNNFRLRLLTREAITLRRIGKVRVVISEAISIPFSFWFFGPSWVVLPSRILETSNDYRLAVRHEIQHHRQRDTLWAAVYEIFVCAFFANPFTYLWKKRITELQEFSCDEVLVGRRGISPHEYGSCLVRVAEAAFGSGTLYAGTTCMGAVSKNPSYLKSFLRRRVEMFTDKSRPRIHFWMGPVAGTLIIFMTIAMAMAAEKSLRSENPHPINPGKAVTDPAIQKITDDDLRSALEAEEASAGFVLVADPNSGKVLAISNFDHGAGVSANREDHWALSHLFGPASVAKSLVAAQAIDRGVAIPQDEFNCENGSYQYGDHIYHDWRQGGWSTQTLEQAIAMSGDICSIKVGELLGADTLIQMLRDYGVGPGGVASQFPEATTGTLPSPDDPDHPVVVPGVVEGFGFEATPLEMLQAYGAIANGGRLLMPQQATSNGIQPVRRILSEQSAATMKEILRQAVLNGTGVQAQSKIYSTAGKTASAYYEGMMQWNNSGPQKANFASFIGFAPVSHPKIEVYVGIKDPKSSTGAHGNAHAGPVFRRVVEDVLAHLNVPPDHT